MIEQNQRSRTPFDNEWSRQRIADVHSALESGLMITTGRRDPIQLRDIVLEPDSYATIFLFFDRPADAAIGSFVPIDVTQLEARGERVIGGTSARVEFVPAPGRRPRPRQRTAPQIA
jgi:hypothetical protein